MALHSVTPFKHKYLTLRGKPVDNFNSFHFEVLTKSKLQGPTKPIDPQTQASKWRTERLLGRRSLWKGQRPSSNLQKQARSELRSGNTAQSNQNQHGNLTVGTSNPYSMYPRRDGLHTQSLRKISGPSANPRLVARCASYRRFSVNCIC